MAGDGFTISIDPAGLEQVKQLLRKVPEKVGDRAVVAAMKKAIEPARIAAVANVKDRTGALAKNIKTTRGKKARHGAPEVVISTRRAKTEVVRVPGSTKPQRVNPRFYLHLVLLGTKAGTRTAGVGKVAKKRPDGSEKFFHVPVGGSIVRKKSIRHPGGRPNPIFDKALSGPVRSRAYNDLLGFLIPRLQKLANKYGAK